MPRSALAAAAALLLLGAGAAPGDWDLLPEETLSLHHKAVAHWGRGMHETAAREFEALRAARPSPAAAVLNLGMMRLSQRRYEDALPSLERAVKDGPDGARVRYLLGKCLIGLERWDEAIAQLTAAARLDPSEPAIPLRLSEAYLQSGRASQGLSELRRVLALRPEHGTALNRLGRLLEREGKREEAASLLERFARLGKAKARAAERCPYEDPVEPPPSAAAPAGGRWLEVKAVGLDAGAGAVVTVQAGRLVLRKAAGAKPVRFALGTKAAADVIRVDWADGTHTHRLDVPAGGSVVVEEVSAHVW
jgi:tetratricopeptide (TPR) repeat protein